MRYVCTLPPEPCPAQDDGRGGIGRKWVQLFQIHHKKALQHYWKDEARVNQLTADYAALGLGELDAGLCDLAYLLTKTPDSGKVGDLIDSLKSLGVRIGPSWMPTW